MNHPYARTERDLRWLAVNFSVGNITRGIPERLECLAAWHRMVLEVEKAACGEANEHEAASRAFIVARERLRAAGVAESDGEFTFSPHCGSDVVEGPR